MKKATLLLVAQLFCGCGTALCENPRWKIADETPIPAHSDMDVRWEASTKKIPLKIRLYRILPHRFSEAVVSNVVTMCALSERDEIKHGDDGLIFKSSAGNRTLFISPRSGLIHYQTPEPQYGPNNLAKGVPEMHQLPALATNFVKELKIRISDITGYFETDKFNFSEPLTMYYMGDTTITNIAFRSVRFRRSVDNIPFVGGDGGAFDIGEYGKFRKIDLEWHDLERGENLPTVSRKTIIGFLHQGKAFQGLLPMNVAPINWHTVKSVTVKKALPCYFVGNSLTLYPFLVLFTSVDTGKDVVDVQIECPIVDESRVVGGKKER